MMAGGNVRGLVFTMTRQRSIERMSGDGRREYPGELQEMIMIYLSLKDSN